MISIAFRNWNHFIWCTTRKVPNFINPNSQIWTKTRFRSIRPTRSTKMQLKVHKASSGCSEWNPQINLHQQSLKSCNHWIMQKNELMKCRTLNSVIYGMKCEIDDSNRLGNIQGWWTKLKNKSKSLYHTKFEWNSGYEWLCTGKNAEHVNWWNGDGIGRVMVQNAWKSSQETAWI